jgi:hypothetical protein
MRLSPRPVSAILDRPVLRLIARSAYLPVSTLRADQPVRHYADAAKYAASECILPLSSCAVAQSRTWRIPAGT